MRNIIGYLLLTVFFVGNLAPAVWTLTHQLRYEKVTADLLAEPETEKTETSTNEKRAEALACLPASFLHPPALYCSYQYVIPRNIGFIQAVAMPVPTPPPDGSRHLI